MENDEYQVIQKYGVTLRRLTHDKIEMVRRWRNDPKIQQYMEYREEITPEMQEKWFERINNSKRDFYFVIEFDNKEIGLINIRDVNFEKGEGEPGIFIWDDDYLETDAPMRASFCMGYFIWEVLKLKRQIIHILRSNKRAIKYNLSFGFILGEGQENVENQEYSLSKDRYLEKTGRLRRFLEKNN